MSTPTDSPWTVAAAVVAVVALIVAVPGAFVAWREMRSKRVVCEEIASIPLVSVHRALLDASGLAAKLQITYDGKAVHDLRAVAFTVRNAGSRPILEADYVRPITLSFSEGAEVLVAGVTGTTPANIGATIKREPHAIVLEPVLLNSGDTVELGGLVAGHKGNIAVDARIVGVHDVQFKQEEGTSPVTRRVWARLTFVGVPVNALALLLAHLIPNEVVTSLATVISSFATGLSLLAATMLVRSLPKRLSE